MHQAHAADADGPLRGRGDGAAGPFTQGKLSFTPRDKWPALQHHVGTMAKSPAILEMFPAYGTFNRTNVSAIIRFNMSITERFQKNHDL